MQEDCGAAGWGGVDTAKSRLVWEDCEKASAVKSDHVREGCEKRKLPKATVCKKTAKGRKHERSCARSL